jgi:uncharacterized Fe-S cluster protein YjdI/CDGSH-type Zn-finger protein
MRRERVIPYKGKKIVVKFSMDRCTHVAECLMGLPEVFDTRRRPWVTPDAAAPDEVARVIELCPTGALHYLRLDGGPEETVPRQNRLVLEENGPLYAKGDLVIETAEGTPLFRDTRLAFCRCGASKHKPLCDNRHDLADFEERGRIRETSFQETEGNGPLRIRLAEDGPLILSGPMEILDSAGRSGFRGDRATLCRCGASRRHPFCDGSHRTAGREARSE